MAKPITRTRNLKIAPAVETLPDLRAVQKAQDQAEVAAVADREEARKASDPIGQPNGVDFGAYQRDANVTQVLGQKIIDEVGGDVSKLPRWRFTRWYFAGNQRIVVDTFLRQRDYDAAEVEARRALLKRHGIRYAALGPGHSVYPHTDAKLKAQYPSQVEQLGL